MNKEVTQAMRILEYVGTESFIKNTMKRSSVPDNGEMVINRTDGGQNKIISKTFRVGDKVRLINDDDGFACMQMVSVGDTGVIMNFYPINDERFGSACILWDDPEFYAENGSYNDSYYDCQLRLIELVK